MVNPNKEKFTYDKLYGKIPDYAKYLKTFVEMGYVHSIVNIKYKLEYQGITCLFLRYAKDHTGGTYHMLNLHTKCLVLSWDFICIKNLR